MFFKLTKIWSRQKTKNSGISLLISLGVSLMVLGVSVSILESVARTTEQSAGIERSNQLFFAAESGIEAALFHKNARDSAVDFDVSADTEISHSHTSAKVDWSVSSRDNPVVGILKEGQSVQIPLFWDSAAAPSTSPTDVSASSFSINFFNKITSSETADSAEEKIFKNFGVFDLTTFDFGTNEDKILIDWSVSRTNETTGVREVWRPHSPNDNLCTGDTSFICRDEFNSDDISIDSDENLEGKLYPCVADQSQSEDCKRDLNVFVDSTAASDFQINLRSLLSYTSVDESSKIRGIPFSISDGSTTAVAIPKPEFEVAAEVEIGDIVHEMSKTFLEKITIGAFDYLIFD